MNPILRSRAFRVGLGSTAGLALAFTAVMGFAHTKPGRPLLHWMGIHSKSAAGACPLGYDKAQTVEQKEEGRRRFAKTHDGATKAALRPALGFDLDSTTRGDVLAWAAARGVRCVTPKTGPDLDCSDVSDALLPAPFRGADARSLWLTFGEGDKLISVVAVRREKTAEPISQAFTAVTSAIESQAGKATTTAGDGSSATLSSGLLRQASAEYRFHDYYALARATNMGDGFVLTEEYRSLPGG